jgi:hypothetical protein
VRSATRVSKRGIKNSSHVFVWNEAGLHFRTTLETQGMRYKIEPRADYLFAEMVDRDTVEETADFVRAILGALREHKGNRVLISLRESRPVYKVEAWGLSGAIEILKGIAGFRVAFIGDSHETVMAQQYIALLLSQKGVAARNCQSEAEAVAWLQET